MSSIAVSSIVFACAFGGAILGMSVRAKLPQPHLNPESKDIVKLSMGLVGTLSALVLGLLIASAKGSYDVQSSELTQMAARVVVLDRVLAHYGPETKEARALLRGSVVRILDQAWSKRHAGTSQLEAPSGGEGLLDKVQELTPKDDKQRLLQAQATSVVLGLGETRWLQYAQGAVSVSMPLLIVLVFWLTTIFGERGYQQAGEHGRIGRGKQAEADLGRRTNILGKPLGGLPFAAVARGGSTLSRCIS